MLIAEITRLIRVSPVTMRAKLKMAQNRPEIQDNHTAVTTRHVIRARTTRMITSQQKFMIFIAETWTDLPTCHKYGLVTTDELLPGTEHTNIPSSRASIAPVSAVATHTCGEKPRNLRNNSE